jgi:hypothetical protein
MNDTITTPSLNSFRKAGYEVDISHNRIWKIAYNDFETGKIVTKKVLKDISTMKLDNAVNKAVNGEVIYELLPKGGITEVIVFDPESDLNFTAKATCSNKDNYDKRIGVDKCLSRIIGLMLVCEYQNKEGFKVRVKT